MEQTAGKLGRPIPGCRSESMVQNETELSGQVRWRHIP